MIACVAPQTITRSLYYADTDTTIKEIPVSEEVA